MPFKDFTVGQALTSAEVDNFLMRQTVMVFDNEAQRSTELSGFLTEGMVTFIKDTNALEFFDGSSFEPIFDAFLAQGEAGYILISDGSNGAVWQDNGQKGQTITSNGSAGIVPENTINPLLLLGV